MKPKTKAGEPARGARSAPPPVGSFPRFVFGFVFVFVLISVKFVFPLFFATDGTAGARARVILP